ncbi:ATP-binding protein [Pyxidicoccus sp. MSG2]|nr:ATP-binding protein [Pyxidicoccus sp. MSG2]MCY1022172.1 ATP-binding protein [Pyxidicoccus sp. MSG2]
MDEKNNREAPSEEAQLRALLAAMEAANRGDFSQGLPLYGASPLMDRLAEAFNTGAALQAERATQLSAFVADVTRVAREVGIEGRLGGQVGLRELPGAWREIAESVNVLAASLTAQVRCLAKVSVAVARGDLSEKITVEVRGESLALKNTINTMVDQLQTFADEVTRVAKEVGPEGKGAELPTVPGVSGVWKDLTDNLSFTEQLALASRYKSEFLANMSHELRTPLNSLLILAKVLSENKERHLSLKEVEYAKTIHASGADLLALINDILDLSKVEAGKLRVEPCDVPLSELKSFVERNFTHVAEHKGLGFRVTLSASLPYGLRTDPQRLQQVLKNLLSNAFKFTDTGRVELHVKPVEDRGRRFDSELLDRADRVLAFSVVDSGIGIPKDKQHLIFEAFQQADGGTSRKYGGTGLGLSISRELARLLGGELHVESEPGKGSTFTLFLPRVYVGPEEAQREVAPVDARPEPLALPLPSAAPAPELMGRKVLVVDDDIRNIFALTSILEARGLQVLHAENGREGINTLHAHPDVNAVLLDVMMPELDGYETMRAIREDPRFATLRIIAITARALKDEREKCLAAGASDYLTKPVDTEQLLALLKS